MGDEGPTICIIPEWLRMTRQQGVKHEQSFSFENDGPKIISVLLVTG
jgi:hypothetical protein